MLSDIVAPWISPLPLCLVGAVLLSFTVRGRWRRRGLLLCLALLWACSTQWASNALVRWWESGAVALPAAKLPQADAIVMLGGISSRPAPGTPDDRFEWQDAVDRLLEARRLLRLGVAPRLVLSGGGRDAGDGDSEARRLARWLIAEGTPPEQVVVEPRSRNTAENAAAVVSLAREHGWERLVVVTSALHVPRAKRAFAKHDRTPHFHAVDHQSEYYAPLRKAFVPSASNLLATHRVWHEMLGIAYYRITGRSG